MVIGVADGLPEVTLPLASHFQASVPVECQDTASLARKPPYNPIVHQHPWKSHGNLARLAKGELPL